jgi:DNA gyrase subunit B
VIQSAIDEVKVAELAGDVLADFVRTAMRYVKVLQRLDKRADARIVDAIVQAADLAKEDLKDEAKVRKLFADKVMPYFAAAYPELAGVQFELRPDAEHGGAAIHFPKQVGSARKDTVIHFGFLDQPEYEELRRLGAELRRSAPSPYVLTRGEERHEFQRLDLLVGAVEALGRKGLQTQRYKGLGEMNADQLWETTMDPTRRTLLQVRVQDSVEADQIFTILMGDLVEPRRAFIEKNALNVRNLDI